MRLIIDIPEEDYIFVKKQVADGITNPLKVRIANGTPLPKGHGRAFEGIEVTYPPADLCTYPEYRGKPYFSIKYEENGEHFVGFGTYNPEVFSRYLQEYFITPTIIEADKERKNEHGKWVVTDSYPHKVYCSRCYKTYAKENWEVWKDGSLPRNFCPSCGARMNKETDNDSREDT